ncbi:hypothetical protein C7T94_08680 [Pedobacter yulinensis]|uniref:Uncharacterized protein n=1 Tax=Pedobacter yulinensis TaxID=2126353 RepID=A0A2T3HJX1_9SPHI|nr:hypothetical protein [Pedobacter yulinensis]PST82720.1 hypothetical protein C7T94_08680 [Pedobacter yulinensis]
MNTIISFPPSRKVKIAGRLLLVFALCALSFAYSCKKPLDEQEVQLSENLLKSQKKYSKLTGSRTESGGTFDLTDIQREGNLLNIAVKGGCNAADFEVVWDGHILLSYPAQVKLVVHNRATETCGTDRTFNIQIDLSKIIENPDPKDYVFHVANGSVKRDKSLNPDGSVTSR